MRGSIIESPAKYILEIIASIQKWVYLFFDIWTIVKFQRGLINMAMV